MPAEDPNDPNDPADTTALTKALNEVWDEQLRHTSRALQKMSGAPAVIVILVDAPWAGDGQGRMGLVTGIAGSRRAPPEMLSSGLREIADQIDEDAEKIRAAQPFVSDTSEPKEPLS
jgi:hypothetical protein